MLANYGTIETEYSKDEIALIKHFGYENFADKIAVMELYRLMVQTAFLEGKEDQYTAALRRGYASLIKGKTYRRTPEFDDLVRIRPEDKSIEDYVLGYIADEQKVAQMCCNLNGCSV